MSIKSRRQWGILYTKAYLLIYFILGFTRQHNLSEIGAKVVPEEPDVFITDNKPYICSKGVELYYTHVNVKYTEVRYYIYF